MAVCGRNACDGATFASLCSSEENGGMTRQRLTAAGEAFLLCLVLMSAPGRGAGQSSGDFQIDRVVGQRPTREQALEYGRARTERFLSGEFEPLLPHFSARLRTELGGREGLETFHRTLRMQAGVPREMLGERVIPWLAASIYYRTERFSTATDPLWIQWTVEPAGRVVAFSVTPSREPAPSSRLDYRDRAHLRLPFEGTWFVFWGGRTVPDNYHATDVAQRFAYDFVIAREGSTSAGSRALNSDFYCFGAPVLAPAPGRVVSMVDGIPDNRPGVLNEERPVGNHVVIDHGNAEFSVLAHFRQGSVSVSGGERVDAGQRVGECGNSGRSSEPHLHFHLQTTPRIDEGEGLPAQFHNYEANGVRVEKGEPQRGMVVAPES
jgi:hypothetical protein